MKSTISNLDTDGWVMEKIELCQKPKYSYKDF